MVFVNNKKFACESCIKGHRSSSCAHTDRPLYEIKKKGRPVSQCEKCRELRESRRVHSKCNCTTKDEDAARRPIATASGSKSKRFIPIAPALPNGLKDALHSFGSAISTPADARQLVRSLLNPCRCRNAGKCRCLESPASVEDHAGLDALVQAVEMFERDSESQAAGKAQDVPSERSQPPKARVIARPNSPHRKRRKQTHTAQQEQASTSSTKASQPLGKAAHRQHEHTHSHSHKHSHSHLHDTGPLHLPPIQIPEFRGVAAVPTFATIPSISEITSFAGSGCTCGVECGCPGCVEHRGPEHALLEHGACSDGACRTCVDNRHGIDLDGFGSGSSGLLHDFYTLAAKLPEPPKNMMGLGMQLDPSHVGGYRNLAAPVNLPKLCCGGKCGCPDGSCGCGGACGGCCGEHGDLLKEKEMETETEQEKDQVQPIVEEPVPIAAPSPPKSCCCG